MVKKSITPEQAVAVLNEALALDPQAISALVSTRVRCTKALAGHPSIQVGSVGETEYEVGLLGILNGLFGSYGPEGGKREGWGRIAAEVEDDGTVSRFCEVLPEFETSSSEG